MRPERGAGGPNRPSPRESGYRAPGAMTVEMQTDWLEQADGFRHEALLYTGEDELVTATSSFVRAGVAAGEPALVVVGARKIDLLREALGDDADDVYFADMGKVGRNPARIIPAWRAAARDRRARRARARRRRARRVPAARVAAQLRVRRREGVLAPLPVRRPGAGAGRDRRGLPQPSVRRAGRRSWRERRICGPR